MSDSHTFPNFISTYQRVLLSDWKTICKLITKHSTPLKAGGYQEESFNQSPIHVLSDLQLKDALEGPYGYSLTQGIGAYTTVLRVRMATHIQTEDNLKDNFTPLNPDMALDTKAIEKIPADEIIKIQENLGAVINDNNQQIEGQLFFWQMEISNALREAGLTFSELETEEMNAPEPLSELLDRYQAMSITPPKIKIPVDFANYLTLKAYLMILGSLSRQQLSHTPKDIEKFIKALKKPLNNIAKSEGEMRHKQAVALDAAVKDIKFAKF